MQTYLLEPGCLFQLDRVKAASKRKLLAEIAMSADMLILQETHGGVQDLAARCPQLASLFWCWGRRGLAEPLAV